MSPSVFDTTERIYGISFFREQVGVTNDLGVDPSLVRPLSSYDPFSFSYSE